MQCRRGGYPSPERRNMMCPNENGLAEIDCDKNDNCNCYECLLKWLRAESEE